MNIAVIGASGFIGLEVVKILSKNKKINIIGTYNNFRIFSKKKIIYKKLDIYKKKKTFISI